MGNCIPVHQRSKSVMNVQRFADFQEDDIRLESPVKDSTANGDHLMNEHVSKSQLLSGMSFEMSLRDLSNQDEMFFDSQAWLDSDCDDFESVNGDFTPVGSTTPVHHNTDIQPTPHEESLEVSSATNSIQEPAPAETKKQLIELFRESFNNDESIADRISVEEMVEAKPAIVYHPQDFSNTSPNESVYSRETTPGRGLRQGKQKPANSVQGCIPNLVRNLSFSERRKRQSPACNGRQ